MCIRDSGKNTLMTADGKYIVSACDGHIMYGTGCFNVEDTVTVKSDLDISVGNIDFFGDIYIKGNVMAVSYTHLDVYKRQC